VDALNHSSWWKQGENCCQTRGIIPPRVLSGFGPVLASQSFAESVFAVWQPKFFASGQLAGKFNRRPSEVEKVANELLCNAVMSRDIAFQRFFRAWKAPHLNPAGLHREAA
jgi:hypothetical protein